MGLVSKYTASLCLGMKKLLVSFFTVFNRLSLSYCVYSPLLLNEEYLFGSSFSGAYSKEALLNGKIM